MADHDVTDEEMFGVPELPDDDIDEADRVSDGIPLDADQDPELADDADFEEVEVTDDE